MNINAQMTAAGYESYSFRTTQKTKSGEEQSQTKTDQTNKTDNASFDSVLSQKRENVQYKPLGIGFLNVGEMGYGMSATQVVKSDSKDVIVKVTVQLDENESKEYEVNLSKVNTKSATAIEMFAYCQYMDSNNEKLGKWGTWNALKHLSTPVGGKFEYNTLDEAVTDKKNWDFALANSDIGIEKMSTGETYTAKDLLEMLEKNHTLTAEDLEDKDWRDMSDKEWDKLIKSVDDNIDAIKEHIKKLIEIQEKAAKEAATEAPSGQKATAAASAALDAAANGFSTDVKIDDAEWIKENSWTYDMKTQDQTILNKAAKANEVAKDSMTKMQEVQLTGSTTQGVSKTENTRECASKSDEEEKTWVVTAYTEQGIICKQFKDGQETLLWSMDYRNEGDYQKVWDYLDSLGKDADFSFGENKSFWEEFLGY